MQLASHKAKLEVRSHPFLRWAGSKRQLLPELMTFWGQGYERYFEPFAGCACLFYAISPSSAILGDINEELINTYRTVKTHPKEVYLATMAIPRGRDSFYKIRKLDPSNMYNIDRAARFIFLNRFCFNGLYRTNLKGQFNVPYSSSRTGEIPLWDEFEKAAVILQHAKLISGDFEKTILSAKEGDFVYLDPPFAVKEKRVFREYGAKCFGLSDIQRLTTSLRYLEARRVHFVVSYADCAEARKALNEWHVSIVTVQRNIAGFARFRRLDNELLVSNIDTSSLSPE